MRWTDDYMNRERFLRADDSVFDVFPVWQAEMLNGYADEGAAFLPFPIVRCHTTCIITQFMRD